MGRPSAIIDTEKLLESMDNEVPLTELASSLEVSVPTLRARIDLLKSEQGIILESKTVENLRVIKLKERVLNKIENAIHTMEPDDLLKSLNVLNKMDKSPDEDGPIKGLQGLLAAIDEEAERRSDEKVEEKLLEEKTVEVTKNPLNL